MPPGYETEEGEYGVIFRNELNDRFLSIGYSVFLDADKTNPFYSASDAEKARDEFLDAAFGADGYELLSAEYARVDGAEAYLIRCAVNENGETDTDGIVAAVPAQGGFGYYIICGVWARSDAAGKAEIDAAIASLRRTGTVGTRFALFSSEELGFRMLYEKALAERFAIQEASDSSVMSAFFFPVTQNPGSLLEVERASYAENAEEAMAGYQESVYGRIDPDAQATELLDVTVGKTVYLVREYAVHFNGGELWLTYRAVDMEGAATR
ncbi:MAG: hypothetical protein LLF87_04455 [Eubacteriales bacterium]|nr:hypothetical protein [Eubacteriales bacterium]